MIETSGGRKTISTREFGRALINFIGHDEPEMFKEIIHRICGEHHEWEDRVAYEWIILKAFTVTYALQGWFEDRDATLCEEILDVFHENLWPVVVAVLPNLRRKDYVEAMRVRYKAYYDAMQQTGGRNFLDPVQLGKAFAGFIPGGERDLPTIMMADVEAWSSLIAFGKFLKNDLVKFVKEGRP